MSAASRLAVGAALALLAGCSSLPPAPPDGPGGVIEDPASIPDAVPRDAPLSRYGNPASYEVFGQTYQVLDSADGHVERGIASWYGSKFHGRRTSSGETYDMYAMTAAHKHLPLPTWVEVRHLENNRRIVVKVNDRGPFVDNRIIDLSYAAAARLGMMEVGIAPVEIRTVTPADMVPEVREAGLTDPSGGARSSVAEVHYWLQLAAFGESANARRFVQRLSDAGIDYPARVEESDDRLYRVRLGPLHNLEAVDAATGELEAAQFDTGHVIISEP